MVKYFWVTNDKAILLKFKAARNKFRAIFNRKREQYFKLEEDNLVNSVDDAKQFWKTLKRNISNSHFSCSDISPGQWYQHYDSPLNLKGVDSSVNKEFENSVDLFLQDQDKNCDQCNRTDQENYISSDVNAEILTREVEEQIENSKNSKAADFDRVPNEVLELAKNALSALLTNLFNAMFDICYFPAAWAKGIICSIFKGGIKNNPGNYRSISLLSCIIKIFTGITNKRLVNWTEKRKLFGCSQAGFREGKGTVDHIFVLRALAERYLSRKRGKFYCCFVDFSKAFDTVNRKYLIYCLIQNGLHGKFLKIIRSIYKRVEAAVRINQSITDFFLFKLGVRQGCLISPRLFIIFIKELEKELKNSNCRGISLASAVGIFLLMYADDIALIADTSVELQRKLKALESFCQKWGMEVNLAKTKIIVFRNGGKLSSKEKFLYSGKTIDIVTHYKYLGIVFNSRLTWGHAIKELAGKANKAVSMIRHAMWKLGVFEHKAFFKIFDSLVVPILCYGSEVWGYEYQRKIEQVHINFCKSVLGVGKYASNSPVLGECGRLPLATRCYRRFIKYWLKILKMDHDSFPRQCYDEMCKTDKLGTTNWVTKVKRMLFSYGYGCVWLTQSEGDETPFVNSFRLRTEDNFRQEWYTDISENKKLETYKTFKSLLEPEIYLSTIDSFF